MFRPILQKETKDIIEVQMNLLKMRPTTTTRQGELQQDQNKAEVPKSKSLNQNIRKTMGNRNILMELQLLHTKIRRTNKIMQHSTITRQLMSYRLCPLWNINHSKTFAENTLSTGVAQLLPKPNMNPVVEKEIRKTDIDERRTMEEDTIRKRDFTEMKAAEVTDREIALG